MGGLNNPIIAAAADVTAVTTESLATTQELNRFLARTLQQRPRAPYSNEVYQRTQAELLGKGYSAVGGAVDLAADVVDGLLGGLKVRGITRTNWVKSPTMGIDTNADGTVDDFTSAASANHTAAFTASGGYQVITVSAATDAGSSGVSQVITPAAENDVFSVSVEGYLASVVAGFKGQLVLEWLTAADAVIGSAETVDLTATANTTAKIENKTAPATTAKLRVSCNAVTVAGADTGIARYKNCLVEKAATAGVFVIGTKSTPHVRVKATGKIVWGGMKMALDIVNAIGDPTKATITVVDGRTCLALYGGTALSNARNAHGDIFAPGTQYVLSALAKRGTAGSNGGLLVIPYTDGSATGVMSVTDSWSQRSLVSAVGKTVKAVRPSYFSTTWTYYDIDTLQVVAGTSIPAYEPYIESTAHAYWPWGATGGKAIGTVKDELDLLTGVGIKRISDAASIATTVYDSIDTATYTNVDAVKTTAFSAAIAGTAAADGYTYLLTSGGIPMVEVAAANIDELASVGKYYYHTDKTVWYIVAKAAYADIAAARTGLGTTTLYYKLLTPLVYQARWNLANSYQSGSLIVEPMIIGSRKPNAVTSKLDITDSNLPASSIEQVLRHDIQANGVLVETDVTANCTLTDSGTTITITGVDLAKVYTYRCLVDSRYNPGCEVVSKVPLSCVRHDYAAAATAWTLTTDEANARVLYCTNAGGAADIVAPAAVGRKYVLINASGQDLTLKKSGGTGVALGTGKIAHIGYNGTDYAFIVDTNA